MQFDSAKLRFFIGVVLCCFIAMPLSRASRHSNGDLPDLSHWFKDVEGGTLHHAYVLRFHLRDSISDGDAVEEIAGLLRRGDSTEQKLSTDLRSVALRERGLRDQDILALALSQMSGVSCEIYEFDDANARNGKIAALLDTVARKQRGRGKLPLVFSLLAVTVLFGSLLAFKRCRVSSKEEVGTDQ